MKKNIRLTPEQQKIVESHLPLVHWIIRDAVSVNESVLGFEYDDLYQEGCLWLCHAAASYSPGLAQFPTYAKKVVRNGLLSYCRQMYAKQRNLIHLESDENGDFLERHIPAYQTDSFSARTGTLETLDLLSSSAKNYTGIAKLGAEALGMKIQGHGISEIAARYHAPPSHVGAWISRAARKLRDSPAFLSGLLY